MTQYLLHAARTFVFSTAPAPPAVAGALAALALLEERPRLVDKLRANAAALRDGLTPRASTCAGRAPTSSRSTIGEPALALRLGEAALARGVFAQAVGPPATPATSSCLRLTAMASHRSEELLAAGRVLAQAARAVGLDPRATIAHREPEDELYEAEADQPYEELDTSVPYDYEQTARAA